MYGHLMTRESGNIQPRALRLPVCHYLRRCVVWRVLSRVGVRNGGTKKPPCGNSVASPVATGRFVFY